MILFYIIASFLIASFLIVYAIYNVIKEKKILPFIIELIYVILFVSVGIVGIYLTNSDYEWVAIISMLAVTVSYILIIYISKRKEKIKK